jgi:nucleoside-diphosphate-sugar epimerase
LAAGIAAGLAGRRIGLTGGGGFIGSHLLKRLLDAGASVELLGPTSLRRPEVRGLIDSGGARYWPAALGGDQSDLREILRRCDSLVHLAYQPPTGTGFWERLEVELETNMLPTVRLLDAADQAGLAFVCFTSSASVYPRLLRWAVEDGPVDPGSSPYSFVKLMQESCVRKWAETFGRSASILRLATVYGPGETAPRAIPNFIRAVLAGKSPVLEGRGSQSFDVIYIADVVDALILALRHRPNDTLNIGTGFGRTPRELAAMIIQLTGASLPIVEDPSVPERPSPRCVVSRAATRLGFRAQTVMEAGLREEIRWFAQERERGARQPIAALPAPDVPLVPHLA